MTRNLIRALKDEAILLVLDNFETNLKPQPERERQRDGETGGSGQSSPTPSVSPSLLSPRWACQDEAWENCLKRLATELIGSRSRVWMTCRHALTALDGAGVQSVLLGPLPAGEAALYLREHAGLSRMFFNPDKSESMLAMRLLNASRFHPLLMDRLARLAVAGDAFRPQLLQALDTLETTKDFARLPELFAGATDDARELAYLNDALAASLDQLIQQVSPDARRLLWMIAVANEPIELNLLQSVWSGEEGEQTQQLRQIKQMLEILPQLPPEVQEQLKALPPEVHAMIDALPPPTTDNRPPTTNLLAQLITVGLVTEERATPDDENFTLTCHELVRERIRARMNDHPSERDGLTENAIRLGYADHLITVFQALENRNMTAALAAGSRALVYCVQAEVYDRLSEFASGVVANIKNPRLIANLIPHLQAAAETAPEGKPRWSCLCYLADALRNNGRPDVSLPFYEQAAAQAFAVVAGSAAHSSANVRQAWSDVGTITSNWANALCEIGNLDAAHKRQLESAKASKNAGRPAVHVIGAELEALRIQVMRGQIAQALPQVETHLQQIESWWQQHRTAQPMPEAPDLEFLARVYISALDIVRQVNYAQQDWEAALPRIDTILEVKRALLYPAEEIAIDRFNRATAFGWLGRFGEAQAELETCLQIFQRDPAKNAAVLSALADLFDKQGDVAQAITQQRRALALSEQLPDPRDRANSHHNLAAYLDHSGTPPALVESPRHSLADLVYCLITGLMVSLQTSLRNYAIRFRLAHEAGTTLAVPRLADLLTDSAFDPLDKWLRQRGVDLDELQAAVDELLEQVRQQALAQEG